MYLIQLSSPTPGDGVDIQVVSPSALGNMIPTAATSIKPGKMNAMAQSMPDNVKIKARIRKNLASTQTIEHTQTWSIAGGETVEVAINILLEYYSVPQDVLRPHYRLFYNRKLLSKDVVLRDTVPQDAILEFRIQSPDQMAQEASRDLIGRSKIPGYANSARLATWVATACGQGLGTMGSLVGSKVDQQLEAAEVIAKLRADTEGDGTIAAGVKSFVGVPVYIAGGVVKWADRSAGEALDSVIGLFDD